MNIKSLSHAGKATIAEGKVQNFEFDMADLGGESTCVPQSRWERGSSPAAGVAAGVGGNGDAGQGQDPPAVVGGAGG